MSIQPSKSEFLALAQKGNTIPVYLDLTADCETPLGAYSKIRQDGPAFLFESIVGGERISRYSFLGAQPRKIFRIFEEETHIQQMDGSCETVPTPADPLALIEEEMNRYKPVDLPDMPPFCGGAVGYVGHEFVHNVEPSIPKPLENPLGMPTLYYLITHSVLIFDHVRQPSAYAYKLRSKTMIPTLPTRRQALKLNELPSSLINRPLSPTAR